MFCIQLVLAENNAGEGFLETIAGQGSFRDKQE